MKPIIGIISRTCTDSDGDRVICIWEKTRQAIIKKGGIPFLIVPNQDVEYDSVRPKDVPRMTEEEKNDLKSMLNMCDGLLIPGGYKWFEFDEVIYKYALEKNMPILGICLGMQMMCCVDANDGIANDTTIKNETTINHHQRDSKYVHKIDINDNTKLKSIIGNDEIEVNSKHNYHVQKTKNLIISSYSEDGLIESVEYPNKNFVLGVQWHPETMLDYDDYSNKLFESFINSSITFHNKNQALKTSVGKNKE